MPSSFLINVVSFLLPEPWTNLTRREVVNSLYECGEHKHPESAKWSLLSEDELWCFESTHYAMFYDRYARHLGVRTVVVLFLISGTVEALPLLSLLLASDASRIDRFRNTSPEVYFLR